MATPALKLRGTLNIQYQELSVVQITGITCSLPALTVILKSLMAALEARGGAMEGLDHRSLAR